jgi:MoaA/NifB/PqqE/SkfB family radical SAM enzyme
MRAFYPKRIQIEVTNRCNLDCSMCPRSQFDLDEKDIDLNIFGLILEKLRPGSEIILTGWGEPLLHPDIFQMISLCKKRGCSASLTTNGTLLSEDNSFRLIESGIDSVAISVDTFSRIPDSDMRHRFLSIKDNIRNLILAKGKSRKPKIILQPTLHKGKEEDVIGIIKESKLLGVDKINIARLDRRFNRNLLFYQDSEELAVARRINKLSSQLKIKVDMVPFLKSGFFRGIFLLGIFKRICRLIRSCPKVYDYLYITVEGKVTPCCGIPRYIVGDLLLSSVKEIWNGRLMKEFEDKQTDICQGCQIYT